MDATDKSQALQRLLVKARRDCAEQSALPDVLRYAMAGYLIGAMKYDPNQPRDDRGRWGEGGSGGASGESGGGGDGGTVGEVGRSRLDRNEDEFRHYSEDDDAEVNETLGTHYQEWENGLSGKERKAFQDYTTTEYHAMNGALRHGVDPDKPPRTALKNKITEIDRAIDKSPGLPEDTILYRGLNERNLYEQVKMGKIEKGNTLTDRGLMSTSPQKKETEVFIDGDHPVLYKIRAEKGARGAYLGFKRINPGNADEAEFLLPRNAPLVVIGASMNDNVAEVELAYLSD